ncbi:recombination protein O N-terminal domain-containing protein, partial [Bacteroidales bacterium OttesenSCG-928-J19]|nr:recombination protein O N-terminal domain-containing protein [Bacteroidales bacterium OttesenSCG-928-J19]
MQYKTRGIVLHTLDYNDRYLIVKIFTEEFGFVSYLVGKTKGKKGKMPRTLFHPLSILDLEVEHHNRRDIQQLKEAKVHLSLFSVLSDPIRVSICI